MKITKNRSMLLLLLTAMGSSIGSIMAREITVTTVSPTVVSLSDDITATEIDPTVVSLSDDITITTVSPMVVSLDDYLHIEATEVVDVAETETPKKPSKLELRRVDREINKRKFIFKGETIVGVSASHYSISSDNAGLMLVLSGITADLSTTSVKPDFAYFYRDNRAVGGRFGFSKVSGTIDSATLDLGDTNDVEMDVPYISYSSETFSYGIFHRAYAALDNAGHFGVFADVELEASSGESTYRYETDGETKSVRSENQHINLSFNPGIVAFVMHNVSATLSFELGGLSYTHIDQYDETGAFAGSRDASKMRFMFNVFAVRFGFNFHIW